MEDLTPGEIVRSLKRLEESDRSLGDRITGLASAMVPNDLWSAEHRSVIEDVRHLEEDVKAGFDRVERTSLDRRATLQQRDDDLEKKINAVRDEYRAEIKSLREALDQKAAKRTEWSRQLKIAVFSIAGAIAAAIAGAWVAAILTSKGIR
jgi:predicted  nucleic acid-binding Zn-ribbon protein